MQGPKQWLLIVEFCYCCVFSLLVNSSFSSILSTFLICSFRTSSLYCWSRNFCLMIAQLLSSSVVVEQIVFSHSKILVCGISDPNNKTAKISCCKNFLTQRAWNFKSCGHTCLGYLKCYLYAKAAFKT